MFDGQTIVITGAASGIGRAWAEHFTEDGATVVAADINEAALATLQVAHQLTVDVSHADQVAQMIGYAVRETGRIDVLFNNAGVGYGHTVEHSPDGVFEQHVAIHLFACVNAMRAASRVTASEVADDDILVNMLIPGPTRTPIWGRDMPQLQEPAVTYPTAKLLASLPAGGPTGKVFWNEAEYPMFQTQPES